jgi:pimeloyl-ACP methyl ester carboxylesterase
VSERNIPPSEIAVYGHSLGGAVAVNLAEKHPEAGALITECTLTSIAERADSVSFTAFLPVRLILRERFDSLSKIGSIRVPKLILQVEADNMALPAMALIAGGGHEDSSEVNPTAYFGALNGSLSKSGLRPWNEPAKGK